MFWRYIIIQTGGEKLQNKKINKNPETLSCEKLQSMPPQFQVKTIGQQYDEGQVARAGRGKSRSSKTYLENGKNMAIQSQLSRQGY